MRLEARWGRQGSRLHSLATRFGLRSGYDCITTSFRPTQPA